MSHNKLNEVLQSSSDEAIIRDVQAKMGRLQDQDKINSVLQLDVPQKTLSSKPEMMKDLKKQIDDLQQTYDIMRDIDSFDYALSVYQHHECSPYIFNVVAGIIQEEMQPKITQINENLQHISLYLDINVNEKSIILRLIDNDNLISINSSNAEVQELLDITNNQKEKNIDLVILKRENKFSFMIPFDQRKKELEEIDTEYNQIYKDVSRLGDEKYQLTNSLNSFSAKIFGRFNEKKLREKMDKLETVVTNMKQGYIQLSKLNSKKEQLESLLDKDNKKKEEKEIREDLEKILPILEQLTTD